jgi:predicted Zn-dependent protease
LQALIVREENPAAALNLFHQAAHIAGTQPDAVLLHLGEALLETGQLEEAQKAFQQLNAARPEHPGASLGLAQVHHLRGEAADARTALQPALRSPATARRAEHLLSTLERQAGGAAVKALPPQQATGRLSDPPWPDPWLNEVAELRVGLRAWSEQAAQRLAAGQYTDAEPIVERLTRDYPQAPEGWLLRARLALERNDCPRAEPLLRRHLQLASDSVNGHVQLGLALLCLGRHAEATASLQKALELKPDMAEVYLHLGRILAGAGRTEEAIERLRQAVRYNPALIDAQLALAALLHQTGEPAEARAVLDQALKLKPEDERAKALRERMKR